MSDQDKITGYGPKTDRTYLGEFRTADGRVHRAMLESGGRAPPHCLEAVHSRLRAAQGVFDPLPALDVKGMSVRTTSRLPRTIMYKLHARHVLSPI